MKYQKYKYSISFTLITVALLILVFSCNSSVENQKINLKWNKSYPSDTFTKNVIALKWCLSFLGSDLASDSISKGISTDNQKIISLNLNQLKFDKNASRYLQKLNSKLKKTEEYQKNNSVDLGRYIALTIGSSYHYYRIVNVPNKLEDYNSLYAFDSISGYIDNSSVSLVDRIISYSKYNNRREQAYISVEIDSITKEIFEYETVEVMNNGQLKFGIYDRNGNLKDVADNKITMAGKPAKCIWCHETSIQPIFRKQKDHDGYLTFQKLQDTLDYYNKQLRSYQDSIWQDKEIRNKRLHTEMEISYIAFMEPSAEHLSNEWGITIEEVKTKLHNLKTHRHHEFDFLGDLYHRREIDALAPWKTLEVPENIREESTNEINHIN
ncbi:hypothetical protein D1818_06435 [Aquimarina sp. BL5]|uniref:hypothetical protein n=1 Tax=Aquimarina sp. BL5 TaxID=1714860 RepID=UPI000E539054|nr:hypothetical protein [Aquimarina sp. BL5]AXT50484.1 hypothetical protein D1818_06435 [Aquimarina sp. BL5]RKM87641.1 hypothetical protein D7036_25030 [Aquimarina sp. BL5]